MFKVNEIDGEHKDVITDISYDHYEQRIASCSRDQCISVWDLNIFGNWELCATWRAHQGSILKIQWCHPEFGHLLATCSSDTTITIWEERDAPPYIKEAKNGKHWVKCASLLEAKSSVNDIKFAPKSFGLVLAACSSEGILRIYEAFSVTNVSEWNLQHEMIEKVPFSCLSWTRSHLKSHRPMIAVGSDDSKSVNAKVYLFEYFEQSHKWVCSETINGIDEPVFDVSFAPRFSKPFQLLAVATKRVTLIKIAPLHTDLNSTLSNNIVRNDIQNLAQFNDHYSSVLKVSWNFNGTGLVSSGIDGCVHMYQVTFNDTWKHLAELKGDENSSEINRDTPVLPPLRFTGVNLTIRRESNGSN